MLVHRLRRWSNIKPTLFQCVLFVGRRRFTAVGHCYKLWVLWPQGGFADNKHVYRLYRIKCGGNRPLRRRTSIEPILCQRIMFAGLLLPGALALVAGSFCHDTWNTTGPPRIQALCQFFTVLSIPGDTVFRDVHWSLLEWRTISGKKIHLFDNFVVLFVSFIRIRVWHSLLIAVIHWQRSTYCAIVNIGPHCFIWFMAV